MKNIYALAPLAGLLLFGGYYWKHARLHEMRLTEMKRQEALAKQEKLAEYEAARSKAIEQAALTLTKRNQERAEKERLEEAQKLARAELEQRRNAATEHARRLRPQLEQLRRELESVTTAVAREEERARELQREQQFLIEYVREAEANRNAFYQLLEKLEAIERAQAVAVPPPLTIKKEKS